MSDMQCLDACHLGSVLTPGIRGKIATYRPEMNTRNRGNRGVAGLYHPEILIPYILLTVQRF